MKIKVGIFFGGPSREREISFAGGRTVYDNLNKSVFEPVPIFVDSFRNFILLDWQYVYKGTIRDFYPAIDSIPDSPNGFQVYLESLGQLSGERQKAIIEKVGKPLDPTFLPDLIDVAFLALHGEYGEDGQIQQELEMLRIPYTGSGIRASQIGMDKALQKELMAKKGFATPEIITVRREGWSEQVADQLYRQAVKTVGFPIVVRPANQGSSIGVAIVGEEGGFESFYRAVNNAFFKESIPVRDWLARTSFERKEYIRLLSDIRDGLGFPLNVRVREENHTIFHPDILLQLLDDQSKVLENQNSSFLLESHLGENKVILESFITGKEFSCIVIRTEDGSSIALPPTEIVKGEAIFDYRSKYMPGFSRKVTPIDLPNSEIEAIRQECERLFNELGFQTYARIDGFITPEGQILLNDPNTTSGMLPSSFFFHQAAEIGLNPSQFLSYIIRASLQERIADSAGADTYRQLMQRLDGDLEQLQAGIGQKKKIAIILGGYSFERHISVESGRNIYEKLASSEKYEPVPVFLSGTRDFYELYLLPINLLLKDNADDIKDKIAHFSRHPIVEKIKEQCQPITRKYASNNVVFTPEKLTYEDLAGLVDGVFIALHGRPGEDGQVQMRLEAANLPYNGSGIRSSKVTINKFNTLQTLSRNGFVTTEQLLVGKSEYYLHPDEVTSRIEAKFKFPLVAKPVDDGCSSAVVVIKNREALQAYARLMFRPANSEAEEARRLLGLKLNEEFPRKEEILFEALITGAEAAQFMEITGGLLTHYDESGNIQYEIFEPSEALATEGVLSLEEKFLAGEGQNITPARFGNGPEEYQVIAGQVKAAFEKAARILDIKGYARIDAFVRVYDNNRAETVIIEVNSLPGMTPATVIFHQAALNGYKPYDFIDKILEFSFGSRKKEPLPVLQAASAATTPLPENTDNMHTKNPTGDQVTSEPQGEPASQPQGSAAYFISSMLSFFRAPIFLKNCLAIAVFFLMCFLLVTAALSWYTKHGQSQPVQNYQDMHIKDARKEARRDNFRLVISDSVFMIDRDPNIIIAQTPAEGSEVKENRRIYVTVTSVTAPLVPLPSLVGNYDYDQYTRKLQRLGLKYKIREKKFDRRLEENTILYFYFNEEKITDQRLDRGVKVPKGSELEFVISERNTGRVEIPNLVCKRLHEAAFLLTSNDLLQGDLYGPTDDDAYIYRMEPEYKPGAMVGVGTRIHLYLQAEKPLDCPETVEPRDLEEQENDDSTNNF